MYDVCKRATCIWYTSRRHRILSTFYLFITNNVILEMYIAFDSVMFIFVIIVILGRTSRSRSSLEHASNASISSPSVSKRQATYNVPAYPFVQWRSSLMPSFIGKDSRL